MPPRVSFSPAISLFNHSRQRFSRYAAVGGASFICAFMGGAVLTTPASAQSASSSATNQQSFTSSGLRVTVTGIKQANNYLYAQFLLVNLTKQRQYVIWVGSSSAAVGSGPTVYARHLSGLSYCPDDLGSDNLDSFHRCLATFKSDIDDASYIEPQQFLAVTITFDGPSPRSPETGDTLSYTLRLIAHTAPEQDQALEASATGNSVGPARLVDISMPLLPFGQ